MEVQHGSPAAGRAEAEAQAGLRRVVKDALRHAGMRQSELAAAIGKTPVDISRYLGTRGRLPRDWAMIEMILDAAGADVDAFHREHGAFWATTSGRDTADPSPGPPDVQIGDTQADTHSASTGLVIPDARVTDRRSSPGGHPPAPPHSPAAAAGPTTPLARPGNRGDRAGGRQGQQPLTSTPSMRSDPRTAVTTPASIGPPVPATIPRPRTPETAGAPNQTRVRQAPPRSDSPTPDTAGRQTDVGSRSRRLQWIVLAGLAVLVLAGGAITAVAVTARSAGSPSGPPGGVVGASPPTAPGVGVLALIDGAPAPGVALRAAPSKAPGVAVRTYVPSGTQLRVLCAQTGDPVSLGGRPTRVFTTWLKTPNGLYLTAAYARIPDTTSLPNCLPGQPPLPLVPNG